MVNWNILEPCIAHFSIDWLLYISIFSVLWYITSSIFIWLTTSLAIYLSSLSITFLQRVSYKLDKASILIRLYFGWPNLLLPPPILTQQHTNTELLKPRKCQNFWSSLCCWTSWLPLHSEPRPVTITKSPQPWSPTTSAQRMLSSPPCSPSPWRLGTP